MYNICMYLYIISIMSTYLYVCIYVCMYISMYTYMFLIICEHVYYFMYEYIYLYVYILYSDMFCPTSYTGDIMARIFGAFF